MQISHADQSEVGEVLPLKMASKLKLNQSVSTAHFWRYTSKKVTVRDAQRHQFVTRWQDPFPPSDTTEEQVVIEDEFAGKEAGV